MLFRSSLTSGHGYTHTHTRHTHSLILPCRPPTVSHPVYFGHFVPPSAAFVSAHELGGGALLCGAAEPDTGRGEVRGEVRGSPHTHMMERTERDRGSLSFYLLWRPVRKGKVRWGRLATVTRFSILLINSFHKEHCDQIGNSRG